jgi:hypothetical protein
MFMVKNRKIFLGSQLSLDLSLKFLNIDVINKVILVDNAAKAGPKKMKYIQ